MRFTNVCARHISGICAIILFPKNAHLKACGNLCCSWSILLVIMEMIWLRLFFNVRMASKPPAEFSPPICVFMELRSNANFLCLVNLALNVISVKFS